MHPETRIQLQGLMREVKRDHSDADVVVINVPEELDGELYMHPKPCMVEITKLDGRQVTPLQNTHGSGLKYHFDNLVTGRGSPFCAVCGVGCFPNDIKAAKAAGVDGKEFRYRLPIFIEQFIDEPYKEAVMGSFRHLMQRDLDMLREAPVIAEQLLEKSEVYLIEEEGIDATEVWNDISSGNVTKEDGEEMTGLKAKKAAILALIFSNLGKITTRTFQGLSIAQLVKRYTIGGEQGSTGFISKAHMEGNGMFPKLIPGDDKSPYVTGLAKCVTHTLAKHGNKVVVQNNRNNFALTYDLEKMVELVKVPNIVSREMQMFMLMRKLYCAQTEEGYTTVWSEYEAMRGKEGSNERTHFNTWLDSQQTFEVGDFKEIMGELEREHEIFDDTTGVVARIIRTTAGSFTKKELWRLLYVDNLRQAVSSVEKRPNTKVTASFNLQGIIFLMSSLGISRKDIFEGNQDSVLRRDCDRCIVQTCPLREGFIRKK